MSLIASNLSPQQADAINFVSDAGDDHSAILEAVAGSGKTTTLVEMCRSIDPSFNVVFTAFNKRIASDIQDKLSYADVGRNVKAATFHSLGLGAWRRYAWQSEVDTNRSYKIMDELSVPERQRHFVRAALSLAKQHCFGIVCNVNDQSAWDGLVSHFDLEEKLFSEEDAADVDISKRLDQALRWTIKALQHSIDTHEQFVDFDDMLYAPLVHDAPFYQNEWVLIDEAQDTNTARRLMAERMLANGGRLIAVGDRHQAIYGFTGADANALDLISERFDCIRLPLTVSWRCARSIVEYAQQYVSHIEAAPDALEGLVKHEGYDEFQQRELKPTDAILCRNTRPLVDLALGYLRRDIPCAVEGRDIGADLNRLATKWRTVRDVGQLRTQLEHHLDREVARYLKRGQRGRALLVEDKVASLLAIMETLDPFDPVSKLTTKINTMFQDTEGNRRPVLTLSTVHKAKGREWDRVFLYGKNRFMPSRYAEQEWEIQQENNIIYVAITRAKRELVEVSV